MQRILVTGAGGFIGGFIVEEAIKKGYQTYAGVRPSTNREYLTDPHIEFIDLPLHNKKALREKLLEIKKVIGRWDYIVHNLGATKVKYPSDFEKINFHFARNLVDLLIELDMTPDLFVYMSTLGVMGPGDESSYNPITPDKEQTPNTAYGRSKQLMEEYLRSCRDFNYTILRPTGVYGPREKDYFLMFKSVQTGFNFVPGFNEQYLSFIYVKDLVDVIFLCIDKKVQRKEYLISDGNCYTSTEFCAITKNALNKKLVITVKLPLSFVKGVSVIAENLAKLVGKTSTLNGDKFRIMKQRNWNCDISGLVKDTGFKPKYDLTRGVNEAIAWYKENKWL